MRVLRYDAAYILPNVFAVEVARSCTIGGGGGDGGGHRCDARRLENGRRTAVSRVVWLWRKGRTAPSDRSRSATIRIPYSRRLYMGMHIYSV